MDTSQLNKTEEHFKNIFLIARLLLFITITLLLCSYLYYQFTGKYDKSEYCFDSQCFVLTSSAHINPNEFQKIKFEKRPPFVIPDKDIQEKYLKFLRSDMHVRCREDKQCIARINTSDVYQILEMKIQGNWSDSFIAKTHDSYAMVSLAKLGKKRFSQQKVKEPWIKKAVSLIKSQLTNPEVARFRKVFLHLDKQGVPVICGEVADNFNADNFIGYITSFVTLDYQPFIYQGRNNSVLWSKTKDKGMKQAVFFSLWKNECSQS